MLTPRRGASSPAVVMGGSTGASSRNSKKSPASAMRTSSKVSVPVNAERVRTTMLNSAIRPLTRWEPSGNGITACCQSPRRGCSSEAAGTANAAVCPLESLHSTDTATFAAKRIHSEIIVCRATGIADRGVHCADTAPLQSEPELQGISYCNIAPRPLWPGPAVRVARAAEDSAPLTTRHSWKAVDCSKSAVNDFTAFSLAAVARRGPIIEVTTSTAAMLQRLCHFRSTPTEPPFLLLCNFTRLLLNADIESTVSFEFQAPRNPGFCPTEAQPGTCGTPFESSILRSGLRTGSEVVLAWMPTRHNRSSTGSIRGDYDSGSRQSHRGLLCHNVRPRKREHREGAARGSQRSSRLQAG